MNTLDRQDLSFAVLRLPPVLKSLMKQERWHNKIFIAGGYIRAIVAGEKINDIDLFVQSLTAAGELSLALCPADKKPHKTDNAITVRTRPAIQIITRWLFDTPEQVSDSFDFTICCAVIYYDGKNKCFQSHCDQRFYVDLASKRLVYRLPIRNEDAGGSLLRVLKYYQRGYRIPLDSLGAVVARLHRDIDWEGITKASHANNVTQEEQLGKVITGLLRVVDPNVDPHHEAHLPSMKNEIDVPIPEVD